MVNDLLQIITAYSSMIECFRERGWFDWADKLEVALLRGYISLIYINITSCEQFQFNPLESEWPIHKSV